MNNQFSQNFTGYPGSSYGQQSYGNSNIILVTGVEEALYRTTMRGSDMLYVDQTQPIFYRVKVDMDGRKSWSEYRYNVPTQDDNTPVTHAELAAVLKKLGELEAIVKPEVKDGQSV